MLVPYVPPSPSGVSPGTPAKQTNCISSDGSVTPAPRSTCASGAPVHTQVPSDAAPQLKPSTGATIATSLRRRPAQARVTATLRDGIARSASMLNSCARTPPGDGTRSSRRCCAASMRGTRPCVVAHVQQRRRRERPGARRDERAQRRLAVQRMPACARASSAPRSLTRGAMQQRLGHL